jgi:RecA/RadA recombinase
MTTTTTSSSHENNKNNSLNHTESNSIIKIEEILTKDETRLQIDLGLPLHNVRNYIMDIANGNNTIVKTTSSTLNPPKFYCLSEILQPNRPYTENYLSSGISGLDQLLRGGFLTGHITELYGTSGCGKTQICMSTTAQTIMNGSQVLVIDTSNSFSIITRLLKYIQRLGGNENDLQRVVISKAFDCMSLLAILTNVITSTNNQQRPKLIMIDSILPLLAPLTGRHHYTHNNNNNNNHNNTSGSTTTTTYSTTNTLSFTNNLLIHVIRQLRQCAQQLNVAIVVTNGIVDNIRPALGMNWACVPTTSLLIERKIDHGSGVENMRNSPSNNSSNNTSNIMIQGRIWIRIGNMIKKNNNFVIENV